MKLKTLTLSVLLALAGTLALAQTSPPPVVVPALLPTVPAPDSPAPDNAAPTSPAPGIAPSTPAAPVLLPTARPGTTAEYLQTTQISFKVLDLSLEARPGKVVKPADLAAANKDLQARRGQIERAMNQAVLTQASKMFTRVLPPVNGNTALLTTSVLNLPTAGSPQKTRAVNVSVTLVYNPAGQLVDGSVSSTDPEVQKIYQALDFKTLIQSMQGSGTTSLYGLPLVQGKATTTNATLPMQGLIQSLSGLIGRAAKTDAGGQASPLTMHTTTTYTGQDAAGNFTFTQAITADPWRVNLNIADLSLDMQVLKLTGGGVSVLRPDGLTFSSEIRQDMLMQMRFDMPGEPYRTVMKVQYGTAITVALKK